MFLASCEFENQFYTHVFTVSDTREYVWDRPHVSNSNFYTYIFFSRVDPDVTVACLVSEDHGVTYKEKWKKTGENVYRIIQSDEYIYKINVTGSGTIAFTEAEGLTEFCGGKIYPFNNPDINIEMTDSYSLPNTFPRMKKGKEFCVLYSNADEEVTVFDMKLGSSDVALYTYGNVYGTTTKGLHLTGVVDTILGYSAACFYFKLDDNHSTDRIFMINATSMLLISDEH